MIKAGQQRRFETESTQDEKLNSVDVSLVMYCFLNCLLFQFHILRKRGMVSDKPYQSCCWGTMERERLMRIVSHRSR
jgi:hypothetical protein